ncbi:amidohydrolase, partial [Candidatus Bathyarchaeota archaeon]|nr:amidohydrolase [Candidatus Bathyarchaeota archaeon]
MDSKEIKEYASKWVTKNEKWISDFDQKIWHLAEPALREYESAAAYVEVLNKEGFTVEEGSGGMPTAFCAIWGEGKPVL